MSGIYINTTIRGIGFVQASKKDGVQPCTIKTFKNGGSIAQMRVGSGGWYFTMKFDPVIIGGDSMALVAGQKFFFEGYLKTDKYTKKGETKLSYFNYIQATSIIHQSEDFEAVMNELKKDTLKAKMAEYERMLKSL